MYLIIIGRTKVFIIKLFNMLFIDFYYIDFVVFEYVTKMVNPILSFFLILNHLELII